MPSIVLHGKPRSYMENVPLLMWNHTDTEQEAYLSIILLELALLKGTRLS